MTASEALVNANFTIFHAEFTRVCRAFDPCDRMNGRFFSKQARVSGKNATSGDRKSGNS
jgi:hypothetical protein